MKLIFFLFIGVLLMNACNSPSPYFNKTLKISDCEIKVYIPERFKLRTDTLHHEEAEFVIKHFYDIDSGMQINIEYSLVSNISKYSWSKCGMRCRFENIIEENNHLVDKDSQHASLKKINGRPYINVHNRFKNLNYIFDQLITYIDTNEIRVSVYDIKFDEKPRAYYDAVKDSIFKSLLVSSKR